MRLFRFFCFPTAFVTVKKPPFDAGMNAYHQNRTVPQGTAWYAMNRQNLYTEGGGQAPPPHKVAGNMF